MSGGGDGGAGICGGGSFATDITCYQNLQVLSNMAVFDIRLCCLMNAVR